MTRSFSSVAKWVLCIVLIALLIATFACCLLFSPGASVASAYNATLPDDGVVGVNLLSDSYYTSFTGPSWIFSSSFTSSNITEGDAYSSFNIPSGASGDIWYQNFTGDITFPLTVTFYGRVTSGSISFSFDYSGKFGYTAFSSTFDSANYSDFGVYSSVIDSTVTEFSNTFSFGLRANGSVTLDIKWIKLELGSSFTGYVSTDTSSDDDSYNQGYDDGYEQGYDQGYEQGTSDGVISANDIFLCTAFDIEYDSTKKNIYINKSDADATYTNFLINTIPMVFLPFSCLYYDGNDGGFYPKDIVRNSAGELPDINDSSYWVTFDTLIECGQWLLDNPNDFLCSYYTTGEAEPAVFVFSDLTKLPNFMSGAGESYDVGYNDGYNNGQYDGNKAGYSQGYNAGYNKGVVSGADYSFLGLIGAVVDAPIEAFSGLLDFEILGVNMSSFVMAMFSLCFIFLLLKLVLR